MNSKERVRIAFSHHEPDRVPVSELYINSPVASQILGRTAYTGSVSYTHLGQPLYTEAYEAVYKMDAILRGEAVDYWTELEAPIIYTGGEGVHDPATYAGILDRVSEKFGE